MAWTGQEFQTAASVRAAPQETRGEREKEKKEDCEDKGKKSQTSSDIVTSRELNPLNTRQTIIIMITNVNLYSRLTSSLP